MPKKSFMEKFLGDFYTSNSAKGPQGPSAKELAKAAAAVREAQGKAAGQAVFHAFNAHHLFKKAHRMVAR